MLDRHKQAVNLGAWNAKDMGYAVGFEHSNDGVGTVLGVVGFGHGFCEDLVDLWVQCLVDSEVRVQRKLKQKFFGQYAAYPEMDIEDN